MKNNLRSKVIISLAVLLTTSYYASAADTVKACNGNCASTSSTGPNLQYRGLYNYTDLPFEVSWLVDTSKGQLGKVYPSDQSTVLPNPDDLKFYYEIPAASVPASYNGPGTPTVLTLIYQERDDLNIYGWISPYNTDGSLITGWGVNVSDGGDIINLSGNWYDKQIFNPQTGITETIRFVNNKSGDGKYPQQGSITICYTGYAPCN